MRHLNQKEWVAVVVSLFVVGFFFVFGSSVVSFFQKTTDSMNSINTISSPQVTITDEVIGMGDEAKAGSRVTVHFVGHFVDGKIFASSIERKEPVQFILGAGQVISGWDKGILGMREGGKRIISIPPELGYGPNDYGPIPGNSTLIFEIELLKVDPK